MNKVFGTVCDIQLFSDRMTRFIIDFDHVNIEIF